MSVGIDCATHGRQPEIFVHLERAAISPFLLKTALRLARPDLHLQWRFLALKLNLKVPRDTRVAPLKVLALSQL